MSRRVTRAGAAPVRPPAPAAPSPAEAGLTAPLSLLAAAGPLVLAALGATMAAWTWRRWPDVVVDFGRELYVPWQLAEGRRLFADVAWFNGPLSPYANSLAFRAFGASLTTLVWLNLALLALAVALLYRLLAHVSDRASATAACAVFLTVFAFAQLVGIGNYNWVTPYSHEVTHGVLLAVASVAALGRWGGRKSIAWVALSGAAVGLAFLTKAETFLAAAVSSALALGLYLWLEPRARSRAGRAAAVFAAAALLPVALAFALLALAMPAGEALRGTLGAWPSVLAGEVAELPFYRAGMGLDRPAENLEAMLRWAGGWALALAPAAGLAFFLRGRAWAVAVFALQALVLWSVADQVRWLDAAKPLPLFLLLAAAAFAVAIVRRRERRAGQGVVELALIALSLALLGKMILDARVINYGFALAMPAALVVAVALVGWIPALLDRRGANGAVFRAAALAVLAVGVAQHLREIDRWRDHKTIPVGQGGDRFLADQRAVCVNAALAEIARVLPPGGTLAVLPEGVMLNWLARIPNPTPFVNYMPPELILFGEGRILASLQASPPDAVALVHKHTGEYGYDYFGRDYGQRLWAWIQAAYEPVQTLCDPPLVPGSRFGVQVLARRAEVR